MRSRHLLVPGIRHSVKRNCVARVMKLLLNRDVVVVTGHGLAVFPDLNRIAIQDADRNFLSAEFYGSVRR